MQNIHRIRIYRISLIRNNTRFYKLLGFFVDFFCLSAHSTRIWARWVYFVCMSVTVCVQFQKSHKILSRAAHQVHMHRH